MSIKYKGKTVSGGGTQFTTDDTLTMSAGNVLSVTTPVKAVTQAEFDALPDEERKGLQIITDASISLTDRGEVYSTEEQVIGTWIDGKPLYRKVFEVNSPAVGGYVVVIPANKLTNFVIRNLSGYLHSSSNSANCPINFMYSAAYVSTWQFGGAIYMETNNGNYANSPAEIIIEYTKTTDKAVNE